MFREQIGDAGRPFKCLPNKKNETIAQSLQLPAAITVIYKLSWIKAAKFFCLKR